MDIEKLIESIRKNHILITDHADEEATSDGPSYDEILFSTLKGEIIEDYPDDRPYPSCLIFGETFSGNPVHSVWAYNIDTGWAVLITVYRPDPEKWFNWTQRKK